MSDILLTKKDIPIDKRIIFALDVDTEEKAREWVHKLKIHIKFYKVGLELFLAGWFKIVDWIIEQDLEVMLIGCRHKRLFRQYRSSLAHADDKGADSGSNDTTSYRKMAQSRGIGRRKKDLQ